MKPKYVLCTHAFGYDLTEGRIYKATWYNDIFCRVMSDMNREASCFGSRFIEIPEKVAHSRLVKLIYDVKE